MPDTTPSPQAVYAALDHERQTRDISWRQLAKQAGVSPSTLSRLAQGQPPSWDGLMRLSTWANADLDEFVGRGSPRMDTDQAPPAFIASYLRTRKELDDASVEALEAIVQAAYDKLRTQPDDAT